MFIFRRKKRATGETSDLPLKRGATNFNRTLEGAAYGGQLEVMKFLIDEKGANDFNGALSPQLTM